MSIPAIIMIVLFALSLGSNLVMHGKPKEGNYNFGIALVSCAIQVGLLWWGGFFN